MATSPASAPAAAPGGLPAAEDYRIASVDEAEVLRYLGGPRAVAGDGALARRVRAACDRALALARPRGALRSFPLAPAGDDGALGLTGARLRLPGEDVARHLAGCTEAVLLVVTLGADVDRELSLLGATDPVGQVVLDAAATALAERAADAATARVVAHAAARGLGATGRFSPGYGDLPLSCQADLLAAVDALRLLGVGLTASGLMVPTKSVSAVVGVGPGVRPDPALGGDSRRGACGVCQLRDFCSLRRSGGTCHA